MILLVLSQLADGLSFGLAIGHGTELNPIAAALLAAGGLGLVWAAKSVAILLIALIALRLAHRRRLLLTLAWVGIFGAVSNLSALL